MSDVELRDRIEIITLTKDQASLPSKAWHDPIVVYGVSFLIVAALSFYGGFRWAVDRKTATERQVIVAIGRACIDYVHSLKPRKVAAEPEAAMWIANNCEQIAQWGFDRINDMASGTIRK